ncbi:MAG: membrane protein [Chitinophagales bacterium]|nr:MAG: membrane protein [Chitinophagales bacterium]
MDWQALLTPEAFISLVTLTFMEIVLGIDNIIFISIVAGKLPEEKQARVRTIGLGLALLFRVGLLLGITWIIGLTQPLFSIVKYHVTARDLILFAGGLFLIAKSTTEIHAKIEGHDEHASMTGKAVSALSIVIQIILLDMIFSIDSILTAVGLAKEVAIMIIAVIISILIMILAAGAISNFVNKNPTIKILALAFLILIGFMLVLEGLPDQLAIHVPKGYIYFAIFFSLAVEMLNMRMRKRLLRFTALRDTTSAAHAENEK